MSTGFQDRRFLVVVADDFGCSQAVNSAVAEAYDNGILTSASLMAGGACFEDAVEACRRRKGMSVGIHITLCDGRAVSPPSRIPDLVDSLGNFEKDPVKAWLRYGRKELLPQIESEVAAQFEKVADSGIIPTHADGHHHLHMHPALFKIVCSQASRMGTGWVRVPREPLKVVIGMRSPVRGAMPYLEWTVFGPLGVCNIKTAKRCGVMVADNVYGLSRTGSVDEQYLMGILDMASGPVDEIFTHPDISSEAGRTELRALTSPAVRDRVISGGKTLAGYGELSGFTPQMNFSAEGI